MDVRELEDEERVRSWNFKDEKKKCIEKARQKDKEQ